MLPTLDMFRCLLVTNLAALSWTITISSISPFCRDPGQNKHITVIFISLFLYGDLTDVKVSKEKVKHFNDLRTNAIYMFCSILSIVSKVSSDAGVTVTL